MGLLDDAIREHLEFKRLRGADPGEVAREEEEALGAVHRGQNFGHDSAPEAHADLPHEDDGEARGEKDSAAIRAPSVSGSLAPAGQETAELDMRSVLAAGSGTNEESAGDSLEWEVPNKSSGDPRRAEVQEGEELTGTAPASAEGVEDVLEETPDFLRETPDQERLWFEQQPPRDFDFDK